MKSLLILLTALSLAACGRSSSKAANANPNETTLLQVNGMTCENCVRGISGMLGQLPGVAEFQVNLEEATAQVSYDAKALNPRQIADSISRLGFQTTVLTPSGE